MSKVSYHPWGRYSSHHFTIKLRYCALAVLHRSLCLVLWYLWVAIWKSERGLLPLDFSFAVWWFALSWCIVTFGFDLWLSLWFCAIRIWYLWIFGSLALYLWERAVWDLGLFVVACKLLLSHVILGVLCLFSFGFIFFRSYWLVWRSLSSLKYFHNQFW